MGHRTVPSQLRLSMLLAGAACTIAGCTTVRDLHLVKMAVVEAAPAAIPELTGWEPAGKLLEVTLATSTNIRNEAMKRGLHVTRDVYACSDKAYELDASTYVFDDEGAILDVAKPSLESEGSTLRIYIAEKAGTRKPVESGKADVPAYNLSAMPMDICIQVHGRNMALLGFSSNTVTISGKRVKETLSAVE